MMVVSVAMEPDFHPEKPIQLFERNFGDSDADLAEYDVSPHGRHFVMTQDVDTWPTRMHVVLNWSEELKARIPASKEK